MAVDIVPALYEKIQAEFEQNIKSNRRIQQFLKQDRHTQKDVSLYSADLGECVSKALGKCLTAEALPDGKLYWNIAQRTIVPLLKTANDMVLDAAEAMQKQEDAENGIRLTPIRPPFPEDRVNGFIDKLIEYQEAYDE